MKNLLTFVKLLDNMDIRDVINKMFVMQMNINIRGGPRIGEI